MHRSNRRSVLLVVVVMAMALSGCQYVKAGARCRNGVAPGRDKVNVLYCVKGHWKKWMSVAQANKLAASVPVSVAAVGPTSVSYIAGLSPLSGTTGLSVKVVAFSGGPMNGATVRWSATTGSGGATAGLSDATSKTGPNGQTTVALSPNSAVGSYTVTAAVDGIKTPLAFSVSNVVGKLTSVQRISGIPASASVNAAFAPIVVRFVDANGNGIAGATATVGAPLVSGFHGPRDLSDSGGSIPGTVVADSDGYATISITAGNLSGVFAFELQPSGASDYLSHNDGFLVYVNA